MGLSSCSFHEKKSSRSGIDHATISWTHGEDRNINDGMIERPGEDFIKANLVGRVAIESATLPKARNLSAGTKKYAQLPMPLMNNGLRNGGNYCLYPFVSVDRSIVLRSILYVQSMFYKLAPLP